MYKYEDWFNKKTGFSSLGNCRVYRQTKLEKLLATILPHIIPFISKRRRVLIRNYWKYRHARRACTALCKLLKNQNYESFTAPSFADEDYTWEVITDYTK